MSKDNKAPKINNEIRFDVYNERAPSPFEAKRKKRWTSLDMARGIAILLMILSHCVKGLIHPSRIPDWGIIPVHLITKFSSSLFILVFGVSVSLFFIPHISKKTWNKKRNWMLKRGIELMIWYKLLTVVQMFQYYPKKMIMDTLWFKRMPDFVEILSFYAIALLWLPFFLPHWKKLNWLGKVFTILGTFFLGQWLTQNFDFWGYKVLKALIAEEKGFYTFGQLQRGALVFLGLFIGDIYKSRRSLKREDNLVAWSCVGAGSMSLIYFFINHSSNINTHLFKIAKNIGKHPPTFDFISFSVGGSLLILGICLLLSQKVQNWFKPIYYIGQYSLNAFILHIIIIFYFYRYYFALHNKVTYHQSLLLTLGCAVTIIVTMYIWTQIKKAFK